jgi:cytochrome c
MKKFFPFSVLLAVMILIPGFNSLMAKSSSTIQADAPGSPSMITVLSPDQQDKDKGIGPVKSVVLGPLNKKMADDGKVIFNNQCTVCHDIDQKKLAPPLRNITKLRTPEYIMNLLLNSAQMQKENTTIKALLKQYNNLPMPDPALNQAKARSVLEYLRSLEK